MPAASTRGRRAVHARGSCGRKLVVVRLAGQSGVERAILALGPVPGAVDAAHAAVAEPVGDPDLVAPDDAEEAGLGVSEMPLALPGVGDDVRRDRELAAAAVGEIAGGAAAQL